MIGVDTNVLVYAHRRDLSQHGIAKPLVDRLMAGVAPWAIAWPSLYEFYRLVTHPRVFRVPSRSRDALDVIAALQQTPSLHLLTHGPAHRDRMAALCRDADVIGTLVFDVQIAAIFLEHGVSEILTNDGDFRRFDGLKVTNPF